MLWDDPTPQATVPRSVLRKQPPGFLCFPMHDSRRGPFLTDLQADKLLSSDGSRGFFSAGCDHGSLFSMATHFRHKYHPNRRFPDFYSAKE